MLGLTEQALRKRLARGTMEARKNNRGVMVVLVSNAGIDQAQPTLPAQDMPSATASTTGQDGIHNTAPPEPADAVGMMPVSAHRATIEALQRTSGEALGALQAAIDRQERQHREHLDRLRIDHFDEIGRIGDDANRRIEQYRSSMKWERAWLILYMILAITIIALTGPWARH